MIIEYRREPFRAWIYAIIASMIVLLLATSVSNRILDKKITDLRTRIDALQKDMSALETQVKQYETRTRTISAWVTNYSPTETCTHGDYATCRNAEGKRPIEGVSVACPRYLRLGAWVRIAGKDLRCDDRTAKKYDGRFDIFTTSYERAKTFGKQNITVTIYEP